MTASPTRSPRPNRTVAVSGPEWWQVVAAAALIVGYIVWFYGSDQRRVWMLSQLLVPEELVLSWVDHDWSRLGLVDHLPVLAGAGLIWLVSGATGWLLLRGMGAADLFGRLERAIVSLAVGLNLWSLLTLVIGLCGGLHQRWLFGLVAILILVIAGWQWWISRQDAAAAVARTAPAPPTRFGWFALALCVPLSFVIVWGGTLPATHFDVREYHLQVPKEWYQLGRITFLPHNVYGNMPLGAELHAVLGMVLAWGKDDWWWGALIGKTVVAAFGPLGAAGVFVVGRRLRSSDAGAWSAFAYLACPWVAHVSMTGLIDGAVACYVVLAVGLAQRSLPSRAAGPSPDGVRWRLLMLSGFLAGGAVACKYPALLFLVAPLGLLVTLWPPGNFHIKAAVLFSLGVVAGCGLWFAKNAWQSGNPTYPLLYSVFGGQTWNAEKDTRWTRAHGPPPNGFSVPQVIQSASLLLVRSDHHGPWLVPLAVIAFWTWPKWRSRRVLIMLYGLVAVAVVNWWLLTHRVDRFLVPMLPLVAIGAGIGATWTSDQRGIWHPTVMFLGGVCCLAVFLQIASPFGADNRFLIGLTDLRQDLPRPNDQQLLRTRMNSGHRWLNEHVPSGNRVLLVGEAQVFDLEMPILYNTCFDDCICETLLRDRSRDERLRVLRELRISHVFVSWYELDRYRQPGNYGYSDYPTRELFFGELVRDQRLLRRVAVENLGETADVFEVAPFEDESVGNPAAVVR